MNFFKHIVKLKELSHCRFDLHFSCQKKVHMFKGAYIFGVSESLLFSTSECFVNRES